MDSVNAAVNPQPIPTIYVGHQFRSRLEARWALFFDAADIEWHYEVEGYELPSGRYLPDFWLPNIHGGTWFEVKGTTPTERENTLAFELAVHTEHDVLVAYGHMPRRTPTTWGERDSGIDIFFGDADGGWDNGRIPCACRCGLVGFEFGGESERLTPHRCGPARRVNLNKIHELAATYQFWTPK
jgi:hypothetical protein